MGTVSVNAVIVTVSVSVVMAIVSTVGMVVSMGVMVGVRVGAEGSEGVLPRVLPEQSELGGLSQKPTEWAVSETPRNTDSSGLTRT